MRREFRTVDVYQLTTAPEGAEKDVPPDPAAAAAGVPVQKDCNSPVFSSTASTVALTDVKIEVGRAGRKAAIQASVLDTALSTRVWSTFVGPEMSWK